MYSNNAASVPMVASLLHQPFDDKVMNTTPPPPFLHPPDKRLRSFELKAVEKEWQERILWCIDRYQVDPYVRSTTMLQAPRIEAAAYWPYYYHLQAKRGTHRYFLDEFVNFNYFLNSRQGIHWPRH